MVEQKDDLPERVRSAVATYGEARLVAASEATVNSIRACQLGIRLRRGTRALIEHGLSALAAGSVAK
jgi:hypothetical protein